MEDNSSNKEIQNIKLKIVEIKSKKNFLLCEKNKIIFYTFNGDIGKKINTTEKKELNIDDKNIVIKNQFNNKKDIEERIRMQNIIQVELARAAENKRQIEQLADKTFSKFDCPLNDDNHDEKSLLEERKRQDELIVEEALKKREKESKSYRLTLFETEPVIFEVESKNDLVNSYYKSEPIKKQETSKSFKPFFVLREVKAKYEGDQRILNRDPYSVYNYRQNDLFVAQAKALSKYEEEGEFNDISFVCYLTTYEDLDQSKLQTYFRWRTAVRKKQFKPIALSYIFIYVYELINNCHGLSCEDTVNELISLVRNYDSFNPKLKSYISLWLKDYFILYYDNEIFKDFVLRKQITDFYESLFISDRISEMPLESFEKYSSYKITKSKFYGEETKLLLQSTLQFLLNELSFVFAQKGLILDDLFFKTKERNEYYPFERAVHGSITIPNKKVKISKFEKYFLGKKCHSVINYGAMYFRQNDIGSFITRIIEKKLRELTGFKQSFRQTTMVECENKAIKAIKLKFASKELPDLNFIEICEKLIERNYKSTAEKVYFEDNLFKIKKPIEFKVNMDAIEKIKIDSYEIQKKLIVEDSSEDHYENNSTNDIIEEINRIDENQNKYELLALKLTENEKWLVAKLLCNTPFHELIKKCAEENILIEVIIDSINQNALNCINDNLIALDGSRIYIYEDYENAIKDALNKGGNND